MYLHDFREQQALGDLGFSLNIGKFLGRALGAPGRAIVSAVPIIGQPIASSLAKAAGAPPPTPIQYGPFPQQQQVQTYASSTPQGTYTGVTPQGAPAAMSNQSGANNLIDTAIAARLLQQPGAQPYPTTYYPSGGGSPVVVSSPATPAPLQGGISTPIILAGLGAIALIVMMGSERAPATRTHTVYRSRRRTRRRR